MTNFQILSAFLAADVASLIMCAMFLVRNSYIEFVIVAGSLALLALPILAVCTWDSYRWSLKPNCTVGVQHRLYWTDTDGNSNKIAWVHLQDNVFCRVESERAYFTGVGNYLNDTFVGKAEAR